MIDRFTVTSTQKFYGNAQAMPQQPSANAGWSEPQDYVFDQRTGALTVCVIPPSLSRLQQDFNSGFNMMA